jgi:glycosyltransferase involved in cell wall biosynthesis
MDANPPTVLHVIPGLHMGGAEHMLTALVTAKRKKPFSQTVVDLLSGGALADTMRGVGIPVYELNAQNPLAAMLALPRLARLIARLRPTAIQSWLYYGDLASLLALQMSGRRSATRLYWGIRSSDMDQSRYRLRLALAIKACARLSGQPDAVVANSFAGREVHRALGYRPHAFPVIPNGIDTQRFKPDPSARARMRTQLGIAQDKSVVIHVARVDPMKDHDSLIAVASGTPNVQFILVGAGTQNIKAPSNVTALGMRRDMPDLFAAADLAISTSAFGEGFSNVVAEAMACGIPVVATDVGDARRIVGETGTIVRTRDISAMISAIRDMVLEPEPLRHQRCASARKRIEDSYSLDRAVEAFDALHFHGTMPVAGEPVPGLPNLRQS